MRYEIAALMAGLLVWRVRGGAGCASGRGGGVVINQLTGELCDGPRCGWPATVMGGPGGARRGGMGGRGGMGPGEARAGARDDHGWRAADWLC